MKTFVVIPARYQSSRLPGKPLVNINGKPLIQHVYERAIQTQADEVIIATDDKRIEDVAKSFCPRVCMTKVMHRSGTDRIGEVIEKRQRDGWRLHTYTTDLCRGSRAGNQ